jgi:GcrA cell cycle regulator
MRLPRLTRCRDLGDFDMAWTDHQVTTMTKLWQEGLSASQVARQLGGTSRNAVIGKLHRLGIADRPTPVRFRSPGRPADRRLPNGRSGGAVKRSSRSLEFEAMLAELPPSATIQTLTVASCRWPIGDPRDADFGYCGRARAGGSYCEGHAQMAFRRRGEPKQQIEQKVSGYLSWMQRSGRAD